VRHANLGPQAPLPFRKSGVGILGQGTLADECPRGGQARLLAGADVAIPDDTAGAGTHDQAGFAVLVPVGDDRVGVPHRYLDRLVIGLQFPGLAEGIFRRRALIGDQVNLAFAGAHDQIEEAVAVPVEGEYRGQTADVDRLAVLVLDWFAGG